ncbi:MAG TPA: MnhB domain-containing protein [Burkholderiaceae bacterium]|jgi:multicomponent Na+:H+ antiporter subunit B|nr:MnhB domain-containing protein [Burkholderiaceae bacterium]
MSGTRASRWLFAASALVAGPLAVYGMSGLPPFGDSIPEYGRLIAQIALHERAVTNLVAAVIFDYRGFDTLGEQFIIFAAILGVAMLLRDVQRLPGGEPLPPSDIPHRNVELSDAVTAAGRVLLPLTLVAGIYLVLHGHVSAGGGMQGGVVVAGALLIVYVGEGYRRWRRITPPALLDIGKAAAAGAYIAIGALPLAWGLPFLHNVLPLGTPGALASGGTIAWLNAAAGVGVAAGFALIFHEFIEELQPPETGGRR